MVTVRIEQQYQADLLDRIAESFDEFQIKERRQTQLILQILRVQSLKVCSKLSSHYTSDCLWTD